MLGSLYSTFEAVRAMMFQLSGFYCTSTLLGLIIHFLVVFLDVLNRQAFGAEVNPTPSRALDFKRLPVLRFRV